MNFTENLSIPWIRELVDRDPHHRGLMVNPKTAKAKGIEDGDYIEVKSQFGQLTGWAVLSEGIHPEVIGISNATNRTVTHSPITRMGGGQFNTLLGMGMDYTCALQRIHGIGGQGEDHEDCRTASASALLRDKDGKPGAV